MAIYRGFNTIGIDAVKNSQPDVGNSLNTPEINPSRSTRKFRLTDRELVIRDFLNALNIPQGQKPGNPGYGTTLWSFMFEPNTLDVQLLIEKEIRRVANLDARLAVNQVISYPYESGILLEMEITVLPFNETLQLAVSFDQNTSTATSQ
jgi:phage baseplate assembly protein W